MTASYYVQLEKSYNGVRCSYKVYEEENAKKVESLVIIMTYIIVIVLLPLLIVVVVSRKTNTLIKQQQQVELGRVAIPNSNHDKRTDQTITLAAKIYFLITIPCSIFLLIIGMMIWKLPHVIAAHLQIVQGLAHYLLFVMMCNSVVNCFLYAGRFPRFKKYIKTLFCDCFTKRRRETENQT